MERKKYAVYIMSNYSKTLYIGVTNNLRQRVQEHKDKINPGFTQRYWIRKLVYYEYYPDAYSAIQREKQLKNWHRRWKINLIESVNPDWKDLSDELE